MAMIVIIIAVVVAVVVKMAMVTFDFVRRIPDKRWLGYTGSGVNGGGGPVAGIDQQQVVGGK